MLKICSIATFASLLIVVLAAAAPARPSAQEGMLVRSDVRGHAHTNETFASISPRPSRVLTTPSAVVDLAADGGRAAVAIEGEWGCGPVGIWTTGGTARWLRDSANCGDAAELEGLVLAGTRAAWMYEVETNQLHYTVLRTGIPGSRARNVTIADHDEELYLGNLAGDGSLLVYNTWKEPERSAYITEPKLWRVTAAKARNRRLLARWDAIDVVSVDIGRIAMLRADGRLAILNDRVRTLSTFRLGLARVKAVKLTGSKVIVLRGRAIEVRAATRGTLRHRWPTAKSKAAITLEDAYGDIAIYRVGGAFHLLRLSDGRDRVLAIADNNRATHAELERQGLYYAYTESGSADAGGVAFVPLSEVTALFG